MLDCFILTHEQTGWLLSLPDEIHMTVEQERQFLADKADSDAGIELIAEVEGKIVATAGFEPVGRHAKLRHRATFGISVVREYWGLGIGSAMTAAVIECARAAGYAQLELEVVEENGRAVALYEHAGFVAYGRNPRGFRSGTGWQALVLMRLELDGGKDSGAVGPERG